MDLREIAHRLRQQPSGSADDRPITAGQFFNLAYGRPPGDGEAELLGRLVGGHVTTSRVEPFEALQGLLDAGYDLFLLDKGTCERTRFASAQALSLV